MKENGYYVYIMASYSRVLYIGVTKDLSRRVLEHKSGGISGFTQKYKVNQLVYFEEYPTIQQAMEREKVLKKWRREKKLILIESSNPLWQDLTAST